MTISNDNALVIFQIFSVTALHGKSKKPNSPKRLSLLQLIMLCLIWSKSFLYDNDSLVGTQFVLRSDRKTSFKRAKVIRVLATISALYWVNRYLCKLNISAKLFSLYLYLQSHNSPRSNCVPLQYIFLSGIIENYAEATSLLTQQEKMSCASNREVDRPCFCECRSTLTRFAPL
jgi:hypothetical protein